MSVSGHSYRPSGGTGGSSEVGSVGYPGGKSMGDLGEISQYLRRNRGGGQGDTASDTSSQQERNFANLLGGFEDGDTANHRHHGGEGSGAHIQNVGHRLYFVGCEKQKQRNEVLRDEREKTLMKEMHSLAQRPAITSQARERPAKGHTFSEHSREWQAKRDEKVFRKMLASRERDEAEVTASPSVDPNSMSILENSGNYIDPVAGWEIHYAKYCAKHAQPLPRSMFVPNINANAVRAEPDQLIHDRLHGDSIVRTDRLRDAATEQRKRELEDPATGRPYFSPQSLRPPTSLDFGMGSPDGGSSVVSRLHESGKRRADGAEKQDPEETFTPKINPKSSELAERVRRPLYTPGKKKNWQTEKELEESESRTMDRSGESKVHLDDFFRRTTRCDHVKEARLETLRKEKHEREHEHCVFQPRINRHSEDLFKQAHVYGKPMSTPTSAPEIAMNPTASRMQMQGSPNSNFSGGSPPGTTRTNQQNAALQYQQQQPQQQAEFGTPRSGRKPATPSTGGRSGAGGTPGGKGQQRPAAAGSPSINKSSSQADPTSGLPADEYMSNFESQMNAVLDEWRRLEEV